MLKANHRIPKLNQAIVLIVGSPGTGKLKFSKELRAAGSNMLFEIRVATALPLLNDLNRPEIDYVLFVINLDDRNSFLTVRRSLKCLDVGYFINRVGFLVTNATSGTSLHIDSVQEFARVYNATLFTCDIKNDEDRLFVANRVLNMLELSLGLKPNVSVAHARTFPPSTLSTLPYQDKGPSSLSAAAVPPTSTPAIASSK